MNILASICRRCRSALPGHTGGQDTRDQGAATVFVVGFAIVLFACAGLAIDGGRAINARDRVTDVAEQAARAGAGQLDDGSLRAVDGVVVLDADAAKSEADRFVGRASSAYTPTTTVAADGGSVTVRVDATYRTAILGIVGINSMAVSGTATADPATGVGP